MPLPIAFPSGANGFVKDPERGRGPASNLPTLQWAEYELWLSAGGSNETSDDEAGDPDWDGFDSTDFRIAQVSLGNARTGVTVPPAGEIMPLRQPSQQDSNGGIGPMLAFAKRRLQMYPGIQRIVIAPGAVSGGSFAMAAGFDESDADPNSLHKKTIEILQDALVADPRLKFMGESLSLGWADAPGFATFEAQVIAHVEAVRAAIPGGENACCLMYTLPRNFATGGSPGSAEVEASIRNIANWLDRASYVDCSDLPTHDGRHFTKPALRLRGRRAAEESAYVVNVVLPVRSNGGLPTFRLQWDDKQRKFADVNGLAVDIIGATYVKDPQAERGIVLSPRGTGFETTLRLNGPAHTLALWFNPKTTVGNQNLISFKGDDSIGQAWSAKQTIYQGGTAIGSMTTLNGGDFALDTWVHLAFTVNGTVGTFYIDGVDVGTIDPAAIPMLTGTRQVNVAAWSSTLTEHSPNADMDDIFIAPYALSAADIARLAEL